MTLWVCADCGAKWKGTRKKCGMCGKTKPKFKEQPIMSTAVAEHGKAGPWHLVKCSCGHATCDKHTVEGGGVYGTFYQGCGWDKPVAQHICNILNAHWDNWLYDPTQPEKVE